MEKNVRINEPLVSVVLILNSESNLKNMMEMMERQTYIDNIELLCLNMDKKTITDASKERNINLNVGSAVLLNKATEMANGEYITWVQDGDNFSDDKIKKQVTAAVKKSADIVYSFSGLDMKKGNILLELVMNAVNKVGMGAFLIRKKRLLEEGGFDDSLEYYWDYDLWRRIIPKYSVHILLDVVFEPGSYKWDGTEAAIKEADDICSDILVSIPPAEKNYDLTMAEASYAICLHQKLYKTCAAILSDLILIKKSLGEDFGYKYLIQQEILGASNSKAADQTFKAIQEFEKEKQKRTVMFYCRGWMTGGVERVLINLLPGLADKYKVILVSDTSGIGKSFPLEGDILHIKLKYQMPLPLSVRILCLALFFKIQVFVGTYNQEADFLDLYSYLEKAEIRTIINNHIYYFLPCYSRSMYSVIPKRQSVYKQASVVTWLTHFNAFLGSIISNNSIVMPNPNTFDDCMVEEKGQEKIIVCVGRFFDPIKRVDRMLKVFRKVVEKEPEAKLWLVGRYDLDAHVPKKGLTVRELIKQLHFPRKEAICWWGEQSDVSYYYEKAALLMLVSDNEGFGMVLNEAGIKKCPSLIMEIPGVEDIIIDGENGYIVQQDDIDAMAEKILYLFRNPQILNEMQNKAFEYSKRFDKEIVIKRWIQLIDSICDIQDKNKREKYLCSEFGYNRNKEQKFIDYAVVTYQREIKRALYNINLQIFEDNISENFADQEIEKFNRMFRTQKTNKNLLRQYEEYMGSQIDYSENGLIKKILENLPLNDPVKRIGIYGTGKNTDRLLERYEKLVGKIKAQIVFIDSYKKSLIEQYRGIPIYNIHDISQLSLSAIIVSSILYEESMVKKVNELYGDQYPIYRFYDKIPTDFLG